MFRLSSNCLLCAMGLCAAIVHEHSSRGSTFIIQVSGRALSAEEGRTRLLQRNLVIKHDSLQPRMSQPSISPKLQRRALFNTCLGQFMSALDSRSVNVALPTLSLYFDV